jgi:transcriptional regulator with XRE-family HTH domain
MTSRNAADLDHRLAERIRERRIAMGLTQGQLAKTAGVTYQQAHKYETGANKISLQRLFDIALALGMTVSELLDGLREAEPVESPPHERLLLELAQIAKGLNHPGHLTAVLGLARSLAEQERQG